MSEYNGHPSWEHWNATLWVANEYSLYREAMDLARDDYIAIMTQCRECERTGQMVPFVTPDGCVFTDELAGYAWDEVHCDDELE